MNLKVVVVIILYHLFHKVSSNCINSKDLVPFLPISVGYWPVWWDSPFSSLRNKCCRGINSTKTQEHPQFSLQWKHHCHTGLWTFGPMPLLLSLLKSNWKCLERQSAVEMSELRKSCLVQTVFLSMTGPHRVHIEIQWETWRHTNARLYPKLIKEGGAQSLALGLVPSDDVIIQLNVGITTSESHPGPPRSCASETLTLEYLP